MNLTQELILGLLVLTATVDLWLVVKHGYDFTISWQLKLLSQKWPIIPFFFGVLMGHLFFPNC